MLWQVFTTWVLEQGICLETCSLNCYMSSASGGIGETHVQEVDPGFLSLSHTRIWIYPICDPIKYPVHGWLSEHDGFDKHATSTATERRLPTSLQPRPAPSSFIQSYIYSFIRSFIRFIRSAIRSFIHSCIHPPIHSFHYITFHVISFHFASLRFASFHFISCHFFSFVRSFINLPL